MIAFLKAFVAIFLWAVFLIFLDTEISNDLQVLTAAIVAAGALAGGERG